MSHPNVVVVDHYDSYTYNLVHLIAAVTGDVPDVVQHDSEPDLAAYTHIVLSPGPGHPVSPQDFALQGRVFELPQPILGVCLGMQALVTAYSGEVAAIEPAHGEVAAVVHDGTGVFEHLPSPYDVVRYHSLAAVTVPSTLRITATCGDVVMGVAHRSRPQFGVQFHPESILTEYGEQLVANFLEVEA